MLSVICFSKDRPMQVDAYIQSLQFHAGIPAGQISILYAQSEGISYDRAIARHPGVNWVREGSFLTELTRLVEGAERYILLGCDDVVFHGAFDPNPGIALLERDPAVVAFSLRLGANLHSLPDLREKDGLLRWNWRRAPRGHFSYPWDVSASIYRRDFVRRILAGFDGMTNPNRFEAFPAEALADGSGLGDAPGDLACFPESKCATLTINRVQDEYPNEFDAGKETSPEDLYAAYTGGLELDWPRFHGRRFSVIHIDSEHFGLVPAITPPPVTIEHSRSDAAPRSSSLASLRTRVVVWRALNLAKEAVRRVLPRPVLAFVRRRLRA